MKTKLLTILIIIFITLFIGCLRNNKHSISKINYNDVESISIKSKHSDSLGISFNNEQIKYFVNTLNNTNKTKMVKIGVKYWVIVKMKNNISKTYKITDNLIGENDVYIDRTDNNFFENIYSYKN